MHACTPCCSVRRTMSGRCDGEDEGEGEWIACPGQGALEMQKRNCVPGRRAAALVCWEDSRIITMLHKRGENTRPGLLVWEPWIWIRVLLVRGTGRWAVDRGESFRSREDEGWREKHRWACQTGMMGTHHTPVSLPALHVSSVLIGQKAGEGRDKAA